MKRGFTLIELLVTIAIVGILTSVVLSSLSASRKAESAENGGCDQYANVLLKNAHSVPDYCVTYYEKAPNDN